MSWGRAFVLLLPEIALLSRLLPALDFQALLGLSVRELEAWGSLLSEAFQDSSGEAGA